MKKNKDFFVSLVKGNSMFPTLVPQEKLLVKKVPITEIRKGDIVAYKNIKGVFAVHRVIKIRKKNKKVLFLIKGDFNLNTEKVLPKNILGKIVGKYCKNRFKFLNYELNPNYIFFISILVKSIGRLKVYLLRLYFLGKRIKKIKKCVREDRYNNDQLEKLLLKLVRDDSGKDLYLKEKSFFQQFQQIDLSSLCEGFGLRLFLPLYLTMKKNIKEPIFSEKIDKIIKGIYVYNCERNERLIKIASDLTKKFKEAGVNALFIKGIAFVFTLYQKDIGLRTMDDIDVLVSKNDLLKTEQILKEVGFENIGRKINFRKNKNIENEKLLKYYYHNMYEMKKDVYLELHWNLGYQFKESVSQEILRLAEKINIKNLKISIPNPEASLFVACVRFYKEFFQQYAFIWHKGGRRRINAYCRIFHFFYEVKEIIEYYGDRISWERFISLVRAAEKEYEIIIPLLIASKTINLEIPQFVFKIIGHNTFIKIYKAFSPSIKKDNFSKMYQRGVFLFIIKNFINNPFFSTKMAGFHILCYIYRKK